MTKPNVEQQKVIDDLDNNILLFASAGTGKTYTVAKRIENIFNKKRDIKPDEILCLTFTIKACAEMKEDIVNYVGEIGNEVEVRTIHSFLFQIIKQEEKKSPNYYSELMICDDIDEESFLNEIFFWNFGDWEPKRIASINHFLQNDDGHICSHCKSKINNIICEQCGHNNLDKFMHLGVFHNKNPFYTLVSNIKRIRYEQKFFTGNEENDFQTSFNYLKDKMQKLYFACMSVYVPKHKVDDTWVPAGFRIDREFEDIMKLHAGKLVHIYNSRLRQSNLIDFDDITGMANQYLDKNEINDYWKNKYKYITIDEMQDTSLLEYNTLKKIFANNKIMMCGDFFQTIYEWRGSNPKVVLTNYKQEYKAKTYMYSENYRSTKNLTGATFGYLHNMFPELLEDYCPTNININSKDDVDKIVSVRVNNINDEAHFIYDYLSSKNIPDPSKVCIMARSNNYIAKISNLLDGYAKDGSLKFFTVDKEFRFFKKPMVKDFFAFLHVLVNNTDTVNMERIVKKFVKGVGDKKIEEIRRYNPYGVTLSSFIDKKLYEYGDIYYPLISAYDTSNIIIYDTESTGLDLDKDQVVQISAIKLDNSGKIIDTFDQMVIPSVEISKGAYNTHHFDVEYIISHNGISAKEALKRFSEFVKGGVLVGHNNLAYDKPLIKRQLIENGLSELDVQFEFDTLVIAKQFLPHLKNYKLATLCEFFGVVNESAHNAMGDIAATGAALCSLINQYVITTRQIRIDIFKKYKHKFEDIFCFFTKANELLEINNLEGLYDFIIKEQDFLHKYNPDEIKDLEDIKCIMQKDDNSNPKIFLQDLLNKTTLSSSQIDILFKKLKRIPIITVHQSKGCEFDLVIIAGCDNNNFPSYSAVQTGGAEEEKNVFYVAISRAKKKLILTSCKTNDAGYPLRLSYYVNKIPSEFVRYIDYTVNY